MEQSQSIHEPHGFMHGALIEGEENRHKQVAGLEAPYHIREIS
jgi:hypothetical protein